MTGQPLVQLRGVTKRFPGVVANDRVDLEVHAGEVHALLGENGAGKSTLVKMIFGLLEPDEGEVRWSGLVREVRSPADAIAAGVGMIHQHFMLVPGMTVTENVALGLRSPGFGPDLPAVARRVRSLAERYDLDVDPDARVWQLSVGERQRVEILKALARDARLLVLDEPTAVLSPGEVERFITTMRELAADGRGLVFISHKLHEVLAVADRITVLRDGRVTGTAIPAETSVDELAHLMVGRPVQSAPTKPAVGLGPVRLGLSDVVVHGDRGPVAVHDLSLAVRAGEIVGVAGVSGNGQRELSEAIAGLRPVASGTITIDGTEVTHARARGRRTAGLAYVPEERMRDGAVAEFTVLENLFLVDHDRPPAARRWFLRPGAMRRRARELVDAYAVKTPSLDTATRSLSGGNIQKMVLARELAGEPAVLLAAQPTRGVDIGAAEYIHNRLVQQRTGGTAVLLVSEDLDEILALADRVAVMYQGRVVDVVDRANCDPVRLGRLMAGVQPGADAA